MRIVVSGFEPFGGRAVNQSQRLAAALARSQKLARRTLPVRFGKLAAAVAKIARVQPELWLMLGESGKAEGLVLEARAANLIDARIPDNDGAQPRGEPVCAGRAMRRTGVPVAKIVKALGARGIPAVRSEDAGRYACNAAYYLALSQLPAARVLFVHLPADASRVPEEKLLEGLKLVVERLRSGSRSAPRPARSSARRRSARSSPRTRR